MKKVFALILVASMLLLYVGCAPQTEQPNPAPDTDVTAGDGVNTPEKDMSTDRNGSDAQNNKVENSSDELDRPNSDEVSGIVDQDDQHKGNEEPSPDEKPKTNEDIGQSDSETNDIEISENGTEIYTNLSDFLTEEQIELSDKADTIFICFCSHPGYFVYLDEFLADTSEETQSNTVSNEDAPETVMINGVPFYRCDGKIRNMTDFAEVCRTVFTEDCWREMNQAKFLSVPIYMEINGRLYVYDFIRTGLQSMPVAYEVLSRSETEIVYNYISDTETPCGYDFDKGEVITTHERETHLNRLVLTDDGWRYDEYWGPAKMK